MMPTAASGAVAARLPDGRLHLQHGPIDLVIGIDGSAADVAAAEAAMTSRFGSVLQELVADLDRLRSDVREQPAVNGRIAGRMVERTAALCGGDFATAMICVAGAVADEIARVGWSAAHVERLHVNNGGDIAVRQIASAVTSIGVVDDVVSARLVGRLHVAGDSGIGGVATSGWGGRSMSLGIADAVTVLAVDALTADVVATLVANAVDLPGHPAMLRRPANQLRDDSDLGDRLVTCGVGDLTAAEVSAALDAGEIRARRALADPDVRAVLLWLRGERRVVGASVELEAC